MGRSGVVDIGDRHLVFTISHPRQAPLFASADQPGHNMRVGGPPDQVWAQCGGGQVFIVRGEDQLLSNGLAQRVVRFEVPRVGAIGLGGIFCILTVESS